MKTIEEKIEDIANKILPCNTLCQHDYCDINFKDCKLYKDICNALMEISAYQKEIDEEVRLKKCDDMTQEEYNREVAFADWYSKKGKSTPTFSDAIEWARKDLLDNACKWLKENARDYACATVRCPYGEEEEIICDVHPEIVEGFRKAMEK